MTVLYQRTDSILTRLVIYTINRGAILWLVFPVINANPPT